MIDIRLTVFFKSTKIDTSPPSTGTAIFFSSLRQKQGFSRQRRREKNKISVFAAYPFAAPLQSRQSLVAPFRGA